MCVSAWPPAVRRESWVEKRLRVVGSGTEVETGSWHKVSVSHGPLKRLVQHLPHSPP